MQHIFILFCRRNLEGVKLNIIAFTGLCRTWGIVVGTGFGEGRPGLRTVSFRERIRAQFEPGLGFSGHRNPAPVETVSTPEKKIVLTGYFLKITPIVRLISCKIEFVCGAGVLGSTCGTWQSRILRIWGPGYQL